MDPWGHAILVGSESSDTVDRPPGDDCSGKGVLAGGGGGVGAGPTLLLWGRPPRARADPIGDGLWNKSKNINTNHMRYRLNLLAKYHYSSMHSYVSGVTVKSIKKNS